MLCQVHGQHVLQLDAYSTQHLQLSNIQWLEYIINLTITGCQFLKYCFLKFL